MQFKATRSYKKFWLGFREKTQEFTDILDFPSETTGASLPTLSSRMWDPTQGKYLQALELLSMILFAAQKEKKIVLTQKSHFPAVTHVCVDALETKGKGQEELSVNGNAICEAST